MIEYLFFRIAYQISKWLSFKTLYKLSDFLYVVLYKITKYRRNVVYENLHRCFPEYSEEKIEQTAKKYYRHLADMFLETLKFFSLDREELQRRFFVENPEELNKYYYMSKNIIMSGAHIGNWELGPLSSPYWFRPQIVVLYKPIHNVKINAFIKRKRTKHGTRMVSIDITGRSFTHGNKPFCVVMLSDQNPPNPDKSLWVNFFGIPTATLHGLELYAKRYNLPVLYFDMKKTDRGRYNVRIETLIDNPKGLPKGYITWKYMQRVEHAIREKPELWLWSHRRWKHQFAPEKYKLYSFEQKEEIKTDSETETSPNLISHQE